jgi:hypothetical protein
MIERMNKGRKEGREGGKEEKNLVLTSFTLLF